VGNEFDMSVTSLIVDASPDPSAETLGRFEASQAE